MIRRFGCHFMFFALVLSLGGIVVAQPVVSAGGVVNAASFFPAGAPNYGASPGGIVSIFGTGLYVVANGQQSVSASAIPLPTNLGGTSVTIGGQTAALFFVSANQINAQVPYNVSAGSQPVVVKTSAGTSAAVNVPISAAQPGLFAAASTGAGLAAAQNAVVNGNNVTYVANSPSVAIAQNGTLVAYGTGGGALQSSLASGAACTGSQFTGTATATLGGVNATVAYAGCAPGFVGLDQWNITVPSSLPDGCFLPLQVTVGGVVSNVVTVAVSKGGNCSSATSGIPSLAALSSYGTIFLQRLQIPFAGIATISTSTFNGSFLANSSGTTAKSSAFPPAGAGCITEVTSGTSASSGFGSYTNQTVLDAGASLTVTSPSGATFSAPFSNGSYTIAPNLTGQGLIVSQGTWTVKGPGGKNVGAFTATINIPQLFTVTNNGIPGSTFSQSQPLTFGWTCPDPTGQVVVSISSVNNASNLAGSAVCAATCGSGTYTVPSSVLKQLPVSSSGSAVVLLMYLPSIANIGQFTASGLSQGYAFYGDATAVANVSLVP